MAGVLEILKQIHEVRLELTQLKDQMRRAPVQLKAKEGELAKSKARIEEEKEAVKKWRIESDARELSLKQAESRIADLKVKLNMVESNKEYQVIQDEVKRIQRENDTLQDEILTRISEEDEKRTSIKQLEEQRATQQAEFAKFKEVIDYKVAKFRDQIEILAAKLAELEPMLGPSHGDYARLTALKGDQALAECVSGNCQGCFSEQPPQSWQELIAGRPIKCLYCGALLYKS